LCCSSQYVVPRDSIKSPNVFESIQFLPPTVLENFAKAFLAEASSSALSSLSAVSRELSSSSSLDNTNILYQSTKAFLEIIPDLAGSIKAS
jgi:hypothetical protein